MTNTASVINYTIKSTAWDAIYEPTVMQRFALCPMTCGWKRVDTNPYAETIITDFFVRSKAGAHPSVENQSTPLTINTGDKTLDQQFIMVELKCVSTLSQEAGAIAIHEFRVNFVDECYKTVITPSVNDAV